jgi:hypothetical protein
VDAPIVEVVQRVETVRIISPDDVIGPAAACDVGDLDGRASATGLCRHHSQPARLAATFFVRFGARNCSADRIST